MKREIANVTIKTIEGTTLQVPVYEDGKAKIVDGQIVQKDAKLADCLLTMIRFLPRDEMTMENIIQANRLHAILSGAGEMFTLKDGSYNWAREQLKNKKAGIALFTLNVPAVYEALTGESLITPEAD